LVATSFQCLVNATGPAATVTKLSVSLCQIFRAPLQWIQAETCQFDFSPSHFARICLAAGPRLSLIKRLMHATHIL
jgi:hypothetical protein